MVIARQEARSMHKQIELQGVSASEVWPLVKVSVPEIQGCWITAIDDVQYILAFDTGMRIVTGGYGERYVVQVTRQAEGCRVDLTSRSKFIPNVAGRVRSASIAGRLFGLLQARVLQGGSRQPGWFRDPTARHEYRYWDGRHWTQHISNQGRPGLDPIVP